MARSLLSQHTFCAGDDAETKENQGGAHRVTRRGQFQLEKPVETAKEKGEGASSERGSSGPTLTHFEKTSNTELRPVTASTAVENVISR